MKRIAYKDLYMNLLLLNEFKCASITAKYDNNKYIVKSYTTPILIIENEDIVMFDETKYSRTTSKLQNKIRDVFRL